MEEEVKESHPERSGQGILLFVSWLSAFLPYLFTPIVFGPFAIMLGLVLKRDYNVGKQAKWIMIFGSINTIGGMILSYWVMTTLGV